MNTYIPKIWIRFTKNKAGSALDLLRAINSYRAHPSVDEFLEAFPLMQKQKKHVISLWENFKLMSTQELSELAIKLIHEVSMENKQ